MIILGIGNELKCDDGVGPFVIDELKDLETKVANKEIPEKKMADTNNIIARLKKDIEVFSEYKGNENGIVSLILICPIINNQMWTLYIGNNSLATYTFAVNRSYYEAMKIASEKNCEFLDLFGTCGDPGTKEKWVVPTRNL